MVDALCNHGGRLRFGATSKGHCCVDKKSEKMSGSLAEHFLATL
jgi:hypothetical protein